MDPEIGADRLRSGGAEAAPVPQAELTLCAPATTEALTPPPPVLCETLWRKPNLCNIVY